MDAFWGNYSEFYVNEPFYWWQPKGLTISPGNLGIIKRKLRKLKRYEGRPWRDVQRKYALQLRRAGLYTPTRANQRSHDFSAIVRMNKEVFDSLGVAWISDKSIVHITDAGQEYLRRNIADLPSLVVEQLSRYQLPNPAVGRMVEGAGVFPFPVLLSVLSHFPHGIPQECYELFIARIRHDSDVDAVVDRIERYLALDRAKQRDLYETLGNLPIIKDGKIVLRGRRTSLLNTLKLDRSYMLGLLKTTGMILEDQNLLQINPQHHSRVMQIVRQHDRRDCFIRFANTEDWIAFYGQPGVAPTHEQSVLYYRRRGDVGRAASAFREAKQRGKLPTELRATAVAEFRRLQAQEKMLEDFLVLNLSKLEPGLRFVDRQYPTPTGPLDILARDSRRRWVVLELKKGRAGDKVVGQLLRYRGFIVSDKAGGVDRMVRGFAVAPEPDRRLVAAVRGAGDLPLEVHQFIISGVANRLYPN